MVPVIGAGSQQQVLQLQRTTKALQEKLHGLAKDALRKGAVAKDSRIAVLDQKVGAA